MSPALSLAQVSEADVLREENARLRAALEQTTAMAQALMPRNGQPIPTVVATLGLSAISAVCQAALEEA